MASRVYIRKLPQPPVRRGSNQPPRALYEIAVVVDGKRLGSQTNVPGECNGTSNPWPTSTACRFASSLGVGTCEFWISTGKGRGWETLKPIWAGGRRSSNPEAEGANA